MFCTCNCHRARQILGLAVGCDINFIVVRLKPQEQPFDVGAHSNHSITEVISKIHNRRGQIDIFLSLEYSTGCTDPANWSDFFMQILGT